MVDFSGMREIVVMIFCSLILYLQVVALKMGQSLFPFHPSFDAFSEMDPFSFGKRRSLQRDQRKESTCRFVLCCETLRNFCCLVVEGLLPFWGFDTSSEILRNFI